MLCEHGLLRWNCQECRTAADRDMLDRERVDEAAHQFRAASGRYDAVGVHAFAPRDAAAILAYAKATHPDVPFVLQTMLVPYPTGGEG